ncbi:MAG: hypothetical protein HY275_06550, partial [Gemmatimonadetes bacterium]|nr:hypothetical protein [Gemmatimonadota bacterium]
MLTPDAVAPRRVSLVRHVALAGVLASLLAAPAGAQRIFGAGTDADILARGELRWSFGARWNTWDEQLDARGTRVPINGKWTSADAGAEYYGPLALTETGLRTALGDPTAR